MAQRSRELHVHLKDGSTSALQYKVSALWSSLSGTLLTLSLRIIQEYFPLNAVLVCYFLPPPRFRDRNLRSLRAPTLHAARSRRLPAFVLAARLMNIQLHNPG